MMNMHGVIVVPMKAMIPRFLDACFTMWLTECLAQPFISDQQPLLSISLCRRLQGPQGVPLQRPGAARIQLCQPHNSHCPSQHRSQLAVCGGCRHHCGPVWGWLYWLLACPQVQGNRLGSHGSRCPVLHGMYGSPLLLVCIARMTN